MNQAYFRIKDHCRAKLLPFLEQALKSVYLPAKPHILDIGCGTGVPTLFLAGRYQGTIVTVDPDGKALEWLNRKALEQKSKGKLTTIQKKSEELEFPAGHFDLILAEGLLNVIGFEHGIALMTPWIKPGGYLILHDEDARHEEKMAWLEHNGFQSLNSFSLGHRIWWDHYYACLESEILPVKSPEREQLFAGELQEILQFRKDPTHFQSRYYILLKLV